jgi:hypothetical protein
MVSFGAYQTSTSVTVAWRGSDAGSGLAGFDVRTAHQSLAGGVLSPWTSWKTGTTSTTLNAAPGYRYCFQVRATDRAGNTSTWSLAGCTVVPFDDRSLAASRGWVSGTGRGWFRSTYRSSSTAAASLTSASVATYQVGVIATTCATCGSVDVYVGATRVGRLSLVSRSTRTRAVVLLKRFGHRISGRVRLVVHAKGHLVRVDSLLTTAW